MASALKRARVVYRWGRRRVGAFLDREAKGDDTLRLRGRFLFLLLAGGAGVSLALAALNFVTGTPGEAVSALFGVVVCAAVGAVWVKTGRMAVVTHFYGFIQLPIFAGGAVALGQPAYLSWLALTPMTVLFFAGRRAGGAWLVISLGAAAAAGAAFVLLGIPVRNEPDVVLRVQRASLFVPVIAVIGFLFETVRLRTMASLKRAREAAEQANHQKDRFLANVSHEIRTPLNGVLGMTEVLLSGRDLPPPEVVREHLEVIQQSGRMLRVIIDDLLDLARAEAGKLALLPGPFQPARVVEEVVALYAPAATSRGLTLAVDSTVPRGLTLVGDRVRLTQVLNNLVANAVKFTAAGQVALTARVELAEGGWQVTVLVRDTGPGIPPDEARRLFQPFGQLNATRGLGGTGLGLAISRQLATLMGGSLTLESTVGRGSTFAFRAVFAEATQANEAPPVGEAPAQLARLSGKVLVVDDNAINLRVATALLEKQGLEVAQATDGEGALAFLAGHRVDLVLMDRHMPGVDGLDATRELRRREAGRGGRTPVIALTASALKEELDACLAAGMDDVLTKPLSVEALEAALRRHLPVEAQAAGG